MSSSENKKPWWRNKWGRDKICGITHSRLRPGCDKFGLSYCINLKCGHSFYRKPLVTWAEKCKECPTCPICRKSFKVIFCHMIIFNHNDNINSILHFMKVE